MAKIDVVLRSSAENVAELKVLESALYSMRNVGRKFFTSDSRDLTSASEYIYQAMERLETAIGYLKIDLHRKGAYEVVKTGDE